LAGKRQLVVQTRTKLAGLDPDSAALLWGQEVPAFRGMNILTPVIQGNHVFTSSYGGRTFLYEVTRKGDTFAVTEVWNLKAEGFMSTPVVVGGHAYLHLRNQRVTCIDLAKGQERWTTSQTFGKYWSMVARKDRILALDERGILYLIKANPEKFEVLDSRKVSDQETWAHLAVCGGEVYVRELNAITAYQWK
jgi:outer membrane protein assembly factor BamB